jgi:predicted amidohydrolase
VEGGVAHHFNTVDPGRQVGDASSASTAKCIYPVTPNTKPSRPFQNLEKRYFEVGNLGFPVFRAFGGIVGMAICNDRRWPETYRVMGLQGVEMIVLGYNTPVHNPPSPEHDNLAHFHNALVMQAGAYQNGCWVVGVAKAGNEDGVRQIGNSIVVAPFRRNRGGLLDGGWTSSRSPAAISISRCRTRTRPSISRNIASRRRTR